jgi:hypothetical protein
VAAVGGPVGTRVAEGRDVVMSLMLRYLGPGSGTTLLSLPGGDDDAVLVGLRGPRVVLVASVTVRDGRIVHFDGIADPARLAPLGAYLGSRQDAGGEGGRMRG